MHETDLTFCASYEDGAESHTERMKHTQAKSHDSERLQSDRREKPSSDAIILWSEKMALFGVALLISQPSLSG